MTISVSLFFFFNDTATTEIYTLSLHDALPISQRRPRCPTTANATHDLVSWTARLSKVHCPSPTPLPGLPSPPDRKSTRLNSSHGYISYAVFCLKKKN